jgi:hypothetical protein
MLAAARDGFRAVLRSWGLVVLLLIVNLGLAGMLAAPLARVLEEELRHKDAAAGMLYGFDHGWWSEWSERQAGWTRSFDPEIFGAGFTFRNLELLLTGYLPGGFFATRREGEPDAGGPQPPSRPPDPVILGLGVLYLLVQTFLAGGILGALRTPQGAWTIRGLLHGSGFYFGRLARVALLALLADLVVFKLNAPLTRFADRRAVEAVSERTAMAWTLGRHLLLLLALLFVNMLSSYAKVIVVLEERSSAVLAFLSSLSFCLANLWRTCGLYLIMAMAAVLALLFWNGLDGLWDTIGYKTQILTLVLLESLVAVRIALRLALLGGQMALYRRLCGLP